MKALSSQMDIPPGGLNLRDLYRNTEQEESDDEFSLLDIEEAIQDAAQTAQDSDEQIPNDA